LHYCLVTLIYRKMPYEDQISGYPIVKGIAVELPFVKFKYVKIDGGDTAKPKSSKTINLTVPSEERTPIAASRVIVTREAEVTTLGIDPMVSNASVIHELTYGRIEDQQSYTQQALSYPTVFASSSHSLDIII
jgi:hypothetical protein